MNGVKGRIDRLEVCNFKSYGGTVSIGPFSKLTAIIGPNGAGKSNLMDAISFVVGVRSGVLRGKNLKNLIHRKGHDDDDDGPGRTKRSAYVELYFVVEHGDDDEEEFVFRRTISPSGVSEYYIDGKSKSYEQYEETMASFGLLAKARNALVFQGDVENVVKMKPIDRTRLIEEVSGSIALKREYDEAEEENTKAESATIFAYLKKKGMATEKKELEQQRDEADHYNTLKTELERTRAQHALFQLFHIERKAREYEEVIADLNSSVIDAVQEQSSIQKSIDKKNKERAKAKKTQGSRLRELKNKEEELAQLAPDVSRSKEELSAERTTQSKAAKAVETLKVQLSNQRQHIEELEGALVDLDREESEWNTSIRERENQEVVLDKDGLEAYTAKKSEARVATSSLQQKLDELNRVQRNDAKCIEEFRVNIRALDGSLSQVSEKLERYQNRRSKTMDTLSSFKKKKKDLEKELENLANIVSTNDERRVELEGMLDQVSTTLREAHLDRRLSERERTFNEAVESMRHLYPKVLGTMLELVNPVHPRYNVAMTVVLGKNMDAIVVEDEQTALECVKYMKDHSAGIATFLPLDTIKTKPLNEKLRNQLATKGSSSKLVVDVLEYEPRIKRAVLYCCGSTVVCKTVDEAKRLAFRGKERHRSVTIDGMLLRQSGLMTGGMGDILAKSKKWDEKKLLSLRRKRDKYEVELRDVSQNLRDARKEETLRGQLSSCEAHITTHTNDLRVTKDTIKEVTAEKRDIEAELEQERSRLDALMEECGDRQEEIDRLLADVAEKEKEIFGELASSLVEFREYERQRDEISEEKITKGLEFRNRRSSIQSQLDYERSRSLENQLEDQQEVIIQAQSHMKRIQRELETLMSQQTQLSDARVIAEENYTEAREYEARIISEIAVLDRKMEDLKGKEVALGKEAAVRQSSIDRARDFRHTILQKCKIEGTTLPLVGDSDSEYQSLEVEFASADIPSGTQRSQLMKLIAAREDELEIDFDRSYPNPETGKSQPFLTHSLRNVTTETEEATINRNFIEEEARLLTECEKIAPNHKAHDKLTDVEERLNTTNRIFDESRVEAKKAQERFASVKDARRKLFMQAFDHISNVIDEIYKELTRETGTHSLGGSAVLSLEDPRDPYLGGVTYNAIPPAKRHQPIDQLSGGERTLASLAMLFAIHRYRPSPFFVLDEIDAALDNFNIRKVTQYIKRRVEESELQVVAISLKDQFYSKFDNLIGVYEDQALAASRVLTVSLKEYDENVPESSSRAEKRRREDDASS